MRSSDKEEDMGLKRTETVGFSPDSLDQPEGMRWHHGRKERTDPLEPVV